MKASTHVAKALASEKTLLRISALLTEVAGGVGGGVVRPDDWMWLVAEDMAWGLVETLHSSLLYNSQGTTRNISRVRGSSVRMDGRI